MASKIIKRTSAGGVIYHRGKFLAIKWLSHNTIELPKGTLKDNETPEQACAREVKEETGYNIDILAPLHIANFTFTWDDGKTYNKTVHYFLLKLADNLPPEPNREQNEDFENLWLSYAKIKSSLSYPDMQEAVTKAKKLIDQYKTD